MDRRDFLKGSVGAVAAVPLMGFVAPEVVNSADVVFSTSSESWGRPTGEAFIVSSYEIRHIKDGKVTVHKI